MDHSGHDSRTTARCWALCGYSLPLTIRPERASTESTDQKRQGGGPAHALPEKTAGWCAKQSSQRFLWPSVENSWEDTRYWIFFFFLIFYISFFFFFFSFSFFILVINALLHFVYFDKSEIPFFLFLETSLQARSADLPASPAGLLGCFALSGFTFCAGISLCSRVFRT